MIDRVRDLTDASQPCWTHDWRPWGNKGPNYSMTWSEVPTVRVEKCSNAVSAQEIQRLKKRFIKLDRDASGSIDRDEFLQIPAIANNPLAQRLISIFDAEYVVYATLLTNSGGGSVDFQEFVHGLSVFSSQGSREEKLQCASHRLLY